MNSSSHDFSDLDPSDRQHPEWCPRSGCEPDAAGEWVHRQVPSGMIPSQDGRHMTFSLVQCDETRPDGGQATHAPEGMVNLGGEACVFNADALDAIRDHAAALAEQVRYYEAVTSEAS